MSLFHDIRTSNQTTLTSAQPVVTSQLVPKLMLSPLFGLMADPVPVPVPVFTSLCCSCLMDYGPAARMVFRYSTMTCLSYPVSPSRARQSIPGAGTNHAGQFIQLNCMAALLTLHRYSCSTTCWRYEVCMIPRI